MKEKRRNEIAYQMMMVRTKKNASFRDLKNLERKVGTKVKEEREFRQIGITANELISFLQEISLDVMQNLLNVDLNIKRMDQDLRNKIAYQALLREVRKSVSFRDLKSIKREIGNLTKEEEMIEIGVSATELLELYKEVIFDCSKNVFSSEIEKH